jgi:segregation and condensation protein B
MTDERPDSLAAQAASWVPPWERAQRPPDPDYAAAHRAGADEAGAEDDDEELAESNLSDDDDDVDPAFEGPNPAEGGTEVPPELPPFPGESGGAPTVDAPQELPGEVEPEPTDVGGGPELPLPGAIEQAADNEDGNSPLVDAPLPEDGDDAGDVFDAAADDDVTDDDEVDLPFTEVVPGPDEDDEPPATPDDTEAEGSATPSDAESGNSPTADRVESATPAEVAAAAGEATARQKKRAARAKPSSGIPAQGRGARSGGVASGAVSARTEEEAEPIPELAPIDDGELRAALEAILLVVDEPVAEMQLAQIMETPTERVAGMLEDISARYTAAGHGFDLRRAAGGWRLYTRPEYAAYVERFVLDGQSVRLTQAALETLAVVAYKQPVTRSRISAIRGVNCDGVMRTLNTRGLIEECGTEGETGAFLYRTTALFLEKLGLNSVDQLPPLAPFLPDDVEEVLDASG